MNVNRKTLLLLVLLVAVGYAFIEIALRVSIGFLGALGMDLLIGIVIYDYYRAQKEWEQKHNSTLKWLSSRVWKDMKQKICKFLNKLLRVLKLLIVPISKIDAHVDAHRKR